MVLPFSAAVVWGILVAIAVGTYLFRVSFIALFGYIDEVPPWATRALRFVPMAVLAALVAPALVAPDGAVAVSADNERLLAGAAAAIAARLAENMLITIAVGMAALYAFEFLL